MKHFFYLLNLLNLLNLLLLALSWLVAALGAYFSLLMGSTPVLACVVLLFWTMLTWVAYRFMAAAPKVIHWRSTLPCLLLILSIACLQYAFELLRERYLHEHGFPRRYYSWDTQE